MDSPRLAVVIGGVSDDELQNPGGKDVFVGGGGRCDDRCISRSVVIDREAQRRRETFQRLGRHGLTFSYDRPDWGGGVLWWRRRRTGNLTQMKMK